ncbi:MAG: HAMP domain-containing sensor histidine kinase [Elusimicrobia bacterium]|nr:HAMP domain-containing sensor histidine kinase [Elusimicrobiota bacterium]
MDKSSAQKTAAYLTHELRSPLTSIICALELMRGSGITPDESAKLLDLALRNAESLRSLINDILDLSKLQNGQMELSKAPADPLAVAREAVESLLPWAQRRGVALVLKGSLSCPKTLIDARRTCQILVNLLSNAIKFTPTGGSVEVAVETGRRERAGTVVVCVKDSGPGIAPEDQSRIFRYFVQAGPENQRAEGSGLGLPLARAMAELQGGEMWVESAPGRGASFYFTLPVCVGTQETDEKSKRIVETAFGAVVGRMRA